MPVAAPGPGKGDGAEGRFVEQTLPDPARGGARWFSLPVSPPSLPREAVAQQVLFHLKHPQRQNPDGDDPHPVAKG